VQDAVCYLDVTQDLRGMQTASATAKEIRARIFEETGLTASAGISYNKFLAKLASSQRKPNGDERAAASVHARTNRGWAKKRQRYRNGFGGRSADRGEYGAVTKSQQPERNEQEGRRPSDCERCRERY
jgi:nucleotidyltransferase/DNA polymerase involved in DNA repair